MAQMQYPASAEGISNMRQLAADLAEQSLRTNRIILGFQNQCVAYQERLRIEGDSIAFLLSLLDDEQEAAWCAHIGGEPQ
jgi:Fe-S cluster assembly ATPase SufC